MSSRPADIPVFVLCGGLGTRLGDVTRTRPKPMVEIGDRPMLTHVMDCYDRAGFRRFVLCTGYRADVISSYFLNFASLHSDFTVDLRGRQVAYHQTGYTPDWEVTVAHTGAKAMTGARIARAAARHLGDAQHFAAELSPDNRRAMVVPEGCAHGFLTLSDDALAFYLVSSPYDPLRERGVRWDDPAFEIAWPFPPCVVSPRDRAHPDFDPGWHLAA